MFMGIGIMLFAFGKMLELTVSYMEWVALQLHNRASTKIAFAFGLKYAGYASMTISLIMTSIKYLA